MRNTARFALKLLIRVNRKYGIFYNLSLTPIKRVLKVSILLSIYVLNYKRTSRGLSVIAIKNMLSFTLVALGANISLQTSIY